MCRHAAYVGPGIAASELLSDLDHSLYHQSYQPRELLSGVVCADGYGAGWYDEDHEDAGRYAFGGPIWADPNLQTMVPRLRSNIIIAAVRNGTLASGNQAADAAPFQHGKYLWSLNGALDGFTQHWREGPLRDWIHPDRRDVIKGGTDGEYLFAAWLSLLDEEPKDAAAGLHAMQRLCRLVTEEARTSGHEAQLNILASDGEHVYATRAGSKPTQNSLYQLHDGRDFPDAWVLASEPLYDDPLWEPVAPDTVVVYGRDAPPVRLTV